MQRLDTLCACALTGLVLACTPAAPDATDPPVTHRVPADGTPEAVGLLDFLNDPDTTERLLDHRVGLDARAASGLIHHRDGPDGRYGTRDDDPFDSVAEVDGVYYVGPSTLEALLGWVEGRGWVPAGDEVLGVYDGVPFTVDEAATTLAFVNDASHDQLDHDLGLDARAADGIVAAQPLASVQALAEVPWVGAATLEVLRDEAFAASCGADAWHELAHRIEGEIDDGHGALAITHDFDWRRLVDPRRNPDLSEVHCFGIDPGELPEGAIATPELQRADDLVQRAESFALQAGVIDADRGLDALACQSDGLRFQACHLVTEGIFAGGDQWFFVAEDGSLRVLFEREWWE